MLQLRLFGPFEIVGPEGRISFPSTKLSAFLAVLAMAGKPVRRDELTQLLWGSHFDEQARQNFRQALARIRKALGPEIVIADESTVSLDPALIQSDVQQFRSFLRSARPDDLRPATQLLSGDLMSGIDLQEPAWEEWLSSERRQLGDKACSALVSLAEQDLANGDVAQALASAEACIRRDIFREDAHRLAIRALVALGRRAEALKHYQHLSERLEQELGTAPELATTNIYNQVRNNDAHRDEFSATMAVRKPSIAVLPFANLSNEPDQDYFIDGMVDEIITALSRLHSLFVIGRNSSFTYKGRAVDVKQVGRELGVRYVLEGSVRKAGNRLRIGGQLLDATTGEALWADRIEGELADIFELQDLVTSQVVSAIAPKLEQVEIERSKRKPTASLDAFDYYLRGQSEVVKWTREANSSALSCFLRAIELDPAFSTAHGMAARCFSQRKVEGWSTDPSHDTAEVRRLARLAMEFGPDDPIGLSGAGMALAYVAGDLEAGLALLSRSIHISPNLAQTWTFSGWTHGWLGNADAAISDVSRAMQLSPHDLNISNMRRAIAFAYFIAGRDAEAISVSEQVTPLPQNLIFGLATIAASAAQLGQMSTAERAAAQIREADPGLTLSNLRQRFPLKRDEDFCRWESGLRKAGLPP